MFAAKNELFSRPSGYQISRSVRLRSSASGYFNKTYGTSPTSRTTMTMSAWVKRGSISASTTTALFGTFNNYENVTFLTDNTIRFTGPYSSSQQGIYITTAVYRDPSAWYHIVVVYDTTNATAGNRMRLYINGVQVTSFSTQTNSNQNNTTTEFLVNGFISGIGTTGGSALFDGYMTEINVIDGQALTPSSFGSTNANGVWSPIKYAGTYGTNGFYLNFSDNSASTAATIGKDYSGNGNNWTPNNISVTAGVTYDSMLDVPTVSGASSNYAVMNPLWEGRTNAPTNGNLDYPASSVGIGTMDVSLFSSYWEITSTGGTTTTSVYSTSAATTVGVTTGLTYGFRFNSSTGALDYTTNGSSFTSLATGLTSGPYFVYVSTAASTTASFNGGQRPFTYTPPTGFVALNTYNLPAGTITTSGSFTGNVSTDGPFVYLNGVPTAMTINGNAVTFGTNADKLANGFKVRSSSSSYNASGSNTYSITTTGDKFKNANAQTNP